MRRPPLDARTAQALRHATGLVLSLGFEPMPPDVARAHRWATRIAKWFETSGDRRAGVHLSARSADMTHLPVGGPDETGAFLAVRR